VRPPTETKKTSNDTTGSQNCYVQSGTIYSYLQTSFITVESPDDSMSELALFSIRCLLSFLFLYILLIILLAITTNSFSVVFFTMRVNILH
jgi:hypothetical protein